LLSEISNLGYTDRGNTGRFDIMDEGAVKYKRCGLKRHGGLRRKIEKPIAVHCTEGSA